MAKRARRAKVKKEVDIITKLFNLFKKIVGATVVLFAVLLVVYVPNILEERSSNNAGFEHSFVENIEVEEIEVETIEDNFKPITFENSATYWN